MANILAGYWCNLYRGTPAELSIEPAIAALGLTYRTQFPCWLYCLGKSFPDFLLPTIGVILEVDDDSHDEDEKKAADAIRTAAFEKLGYVVVRCTNEDALFDPRGTVQRLIVDAGLLSRRGPGLPVSPCRTKRRKPAKRGRAKSRVAPVAGTRLPLASRNSSLPKTLHHN